MATFFRKDDMRTTNGPMIFFSDPSAEISLSDEIRGAFDSRISFYAYRRPGDRIISFGSSERVMEGIGSPGFVVAPFKPGLPYLTIPHRKLSGKFATSKTLEYSFPSHSTTREEYYGEIEAIKNAVNGSHNSKVVAARAIVINGHMDIGMTFASLCRKYPYAFVFCFSTPMTGCWIGASPELLLSSSGGRLHTMALAGTRPFGCHKEWDLKNIEEQRMVAEYIANVFSDNSIHIDESTTYSRPAGDIEHICTDFSAKAPDGFSANGLESLLRQLSPTPALCGFPKDVALKIITAKENFNRGCYGGFFGSFASANDFYFNVNLRSAIVEESRYCIFAGGGITALSDPISEWDETEMKSQTFLKCVSMLQKSF